MNLEGLLLTLSGGTGESWPEKGEVCTAAKVLAGHEVSVLVLHIVAVLKVFRRPHVAWDEALG